MASFFQTWFGRRQPTQDDSEPTMNIEGIAQLCDGSPDPQVDICFVHGLTGNLMETWTAPGKKQPWPAELLSDRLPNARILTFGYDAYYINAFSPASRNRLIDYAKELLVDLQNDREQNRATARPLIFVAHSMGGLVCKQAILDARHNPDSRYRDIYGSLIGIVFMGTPHRGSWIADWAHIPLSAISKFKSANHSLLEVLKTDNQVLELIQDNFISMIREQSERGRGIKIFCFYEEIATSIVGLIVPKDSAIFEGYGHISIRGNHANMVKFATKNANGFKRLAAELQRWIEGNNSHDVLAYLPDADRSCLQDLRAVDAAEILEQLDQHGEEFFEDVSSWFLQDPVCASFLNCVAAEKMQDSSSRLLWIQGPRGTGKTTVVRQSIHRLQKNNTSSGLFNLVYYFCSKTNRSLNNPVTILRSLMWTLLVQQPQLIRHLRTKYDRSGTSLFTDKLAFYTLADTFKLMLEDPVARISYFIMDGLEQCQKSAVMQFCQFFQASIRSSAKIRWLLTSEPILDVAVTLKASKNGGLNCRLVNLTRTLAERSSQLYLARKLSQLKENRVFDDEILRMILKSLDKRTGRNLTSLSNTFDRLNQLNGTLHPQTLELILSDEQPSGAKYSLNISQQAFETAKSSFRSKLNNNKLFTGFLKNDSIEAIWQVTEELQRSGALRGLGRISQFIDRLQTFDSAIRRNLESSSDILSLIWGPVQALLCLPPKRVEAFETLIQDLERIGESLPPFTAIEEISINQEAVEDLLLLFYQDILEAHLICLQSFEPSFSGISFDPSLARHNSKLSLLLGHIGHHASLVTSDVTSAQIRDQQRLRAHSMATFEQTADSQYRLEFQALRSRISPFTYNQIFDRAQSRICHGTAEWLLNDEIYKQWKNTPVFHRSLIWLNGNPGSGKTFMAAAVISDIEAQHQCLYIFASYENSTQFSANSLFQSLIFQAASKHARLQSMLAQMDERDLTTSTKSNAALLKSIVQSFGPFFIVVDGLDEIAEFDRRSFLEELVALHRGSRNVRLLISARPEDDIDRILAKEAEQFIIHNRNSRSIEIYVNTRVPELLSCFSAVEAVQSEIKRLLVQLAPRAKGMFLYARMVMDTLASLSGLHEIQGYLEDLPLRMDEVYRRVVQRIDLKDQRSREKAKRVIGWVACTPVPMTTLEIEQALLVKENPKLHTVTGVTRFVQLCGPVVEVSNGYLRFVHFTFKEYIYHSGVESYINKLHANWDLAKTCLDYLASDVFDPSASTEDLIDHILSGKYCFQACAIIIWSKIMRKLVFMEDAMENYPIGDMLEKMADNRRNNDFKPLPEAVVELPMTLQEKWPKAYDLLKHTIRFQMDDRWVDWNFQNASVWQKHDPMTTSEVSCRIDEQFEYCIYLPGRKRRERDAMRETLVTHYGQALFKCFFPACHKHREAFSIDQHRDEHVKHHSRPWKCSQELCEFSVIGFNSCGSLNRHRAKCLARDLREGKDNSTVEELKVLAVEAVRQNDSSRLSHLLSHMTSKKMIELRRFCPFRDHIELLAAQRGSLPMMEAIDLHLHQKDNMSDRYSREIVVAIVRSGNPDLFGWLLNYVVYYDQADRDPAPILQRWYNEMSKAVLQTHSGLLYSKWEDYLFFPQFDIDEPKRPNRSRGFDSLLPEQPKTSFAFSESACRAVSGNQVLEARLIQTWKRFEREGILGYGALGHTLKNLAQSSCSLVLARALVQMGADADFPTRGNQFFVLPGSQRWSYPKGSRRITTAGASGMTVLHHAARQSSPAAAELIQFLLENGANPFKGWSGRTPEMESGAQTIKRHLGLTWSELIESHGWDPRTKDRIHKRKKIQKKFASDDRNCSSVKH